MTTLGLLAPLGGSLTDLHRAGQLDRLLRYYVPSYLERFDRIVYFSYEPERIEAFTEDPQLRSRITILAPPSRMHRVRRAFAAMSSPARASLRQCGIVRAFQAPGAAPALIAGVPYVCTYGYSYPAFTLVGGTGPGHAARLEAKRAGMRAGLGILLRRAKLTIVTSTGTEAEARALGARRTVRIPNGVNLSAFQPGNSPRDVDVTFVGRLVEQKSVDVLLQAAAAAGDRPVRLRIIGDGPARADLERLAGQLGLDAAFTGAVSNAKLPDLLRRSRLFVLPSALEGHPKALLEAMATGLACIAMDIPALHDLAAKGAVATVPPNDPHALSREIARLLDDEAAGRDLGRHARELALDRFDLRRNVARETELLAELAGQTATTRR